MRKGRPRGEQKVQTTLYLPKPLYEALRMLSEKEGKTMSEIVVRALLSEMLSDKHKEKQECNNLNALKRIGWMLSNRDYLLLNLRLMDKILSEVNEKLQRYKLRLQLTEEGLILEELLFADDPTLAIWSIVKPVSAFPVVYTEEGKVEVGYHNLLLSNVVELVARIMEAVEKTVEKKEVQDEKA